MYNTLLSLALAASIATVQPVMEENSRMYPDGGTQVTQHFTMEPIGQLSGFENDSNQLTWYPYYNSDRSVTVYAVMTGQNEFWNDFVSSIADCKMEPDLGSIKSIKADKSYSYKQLTADTALVAWSTDLSPSYTAMALQACHPNE